MNPNPPFPCFPKPVNMGAAFRIECVPVPRRPLLCTPTCVTTCSAVNLDAMAESDLQRHLLRELFPDTEDKG